MKGKETLNKNTFLYRAGKDLRKNYSVYILVIPVILFYIYFHYKPMAGLVIAFQDFIPRKGIAGSEWVGFDNFVRFFKSVNFGRLIKNTVLLSVYSLLWSFPAPIILALLLNEVRNKKFKSLAQTITYLPHFVSMIVVAGMITDFCMTSGLFNDIIVFFGGERSPLLQNPKLYRTIYIASGIWKEIGWGSIIYLSALSGVDQELYEAAEIDGAGKFQQLLHVTLPAITPAIIIMLILKVGTIMDMGYEKTILLYNDATFEVADIIASYVYRMGLLNQDFGYSTAVGLFNSLINFALIIVTNKISKRYSEQSLW